MGVLTCYLTRRRIGAYLDGVLEGRSAQAAARHLTACGRCRHEADSLQHLQATLRRTLGAPATPDWTGFWPGIVRGIEERRERVPTGAGARILARPRLAFGGALAAAVVVSLTLWQLLSPPVVPGAPVTVRSADTEHPGATVMVYTSAEQDLAVVWVFGLD
jgi:anti-sigma factor RsiW